MTVLDYRGYQASVSYEDHRLVIHVLHVDDFLTAECDSASDVESKFHELIDDYIETCAELGREPNKPFKGSFNVRMSPELHKKATMIAAQAGSTLNAWVVKAIESKLQTDATRKETYTRGLLRSISLWNEPEDEYEYDPSPPSVSRTTWEVVIAARGIKDIGAAVLQLSHKEPSESVGFKSANHRN